MREIRLIAAAMLLVLSVFAAAETEPIKPHRVEIYNFFELLNKAERIVLAEVGPTKDGKTTLVIRETVKAPENDSKFVDPNKLKRAADLLANPDAKVAPVQDAPKAPETLKMIAKGIPAPREGTQMIFMLWEHDGDAFVLSHPQNVYDVELLPQIKAAAAHPRSIANGRYLREWDRQMAEKNKQYDGDRTLLEIKGGDPVMGLVIKAARPVPSLRNDNSFAVAAVIENTRGRDQDIYDGPAGGYGVILKPKNSGSDEKPLVIRPPIRNTGTDLSVLNIADMTDFTTVRANGSISKELFFDARELPVLSRLKGEYLISVFFSTKQDGRGLDLSSPVWTGTLVSEEAPIRFGGTSSK